MDTWQDLYPRILDDFGWDERDDRAGAEALHARLPGKDMFRHVGTELKHRPRAIVVGCDASLDALTADKIPPGIVVAADGATTRLREIGVVPRVVVTDLDGDPEALRWAADQGASMVIHGHGDNIAAMDLIPELGPFVAGTYQATPDPGLAPMRNLGGFTDGDRAVLLCEAYGVKEILLACFDMNAPSSKHTHQSDPARKPRKLAYARQIIDGVTGRGARVSHLPMPGP